MAIYSDLDDEIKPDGCTTDWAARVERCRRDFERTGNLLYLWEAIPNAIRQNGLSRRTEYQMPDWIVFALRTMTKSLLDPETTHSTLHAALGFPSDDLKKVREQWGGIWAEREKTAAKVIDLMWDQGLSLNEAAKIGFWKEKWGSEGRLREYVRKADRWALSKMRERLDDPTGDHLAYSKLCKEGGRKRRS